jgi:uroporphyrinogen decarboxylase
MSEDRMNPKERFEAFLAGKPLDRFLCVPLILNHAARIAGVKISEYNRSGQVMAECHIKAYRRYGHDLITIFSDTAITAEAMGSQLYYPEDDVPRLERPAVTDVNDLSRLRRARPSDGRLPVYIEAIRTVVSRVGEEVPVACCFIAPFSTAAALRGVDQFARDLYRNKSLAHHLLRLSLESSKDLADAIIGAGGVPIVGDPVATGSILGERLFREFALPYLKELHAHIASRGVPPLLHICGQTSRILDAMSESGAALFSLDDISMAEARDRVGEKVALMGNVHPAQTLLRGKPEEVLAEVKELCAIGRTSKCGFIVGSGCEVPIGAPPENVEAMMAGVREYGKLN